MTAASVIFNIWTVLVGTFVVMFYQLGIYATLAGFISMLIYLPIQICIGRIVFSLRWVISVNHYISWYMMNIDLRYSVLQQNGRFFSSL